MRYNSNQPILVHQARTLGILKGTLAWHVAWSRTPVAQKEIGFFLGAQIIVACSTLGWLAYQRCSSQRRHCGESGR